jgi:hypothetical protein
MIFKCVDFDDITPDIYSSLWEYGNLKELDINNVLKTPSFESDSGNVSDVVGGL